MTEEEQTHRPGHDDAPRSRLGKALSVFTDIRRGEAIPVLMLFIQALLILQAYYFLKPVREALILTDFSSEVRAYVAGATAFVLVIVLPFYGMLVRSHSRLGLYRWITVFFVANLGIFYLLAQIGVPLAVPFYIWVGVFNLMIIAQFWAFCADLLSVGAGHRLFPFIAVGMSTGGLLGAFGAKQLSTTLGPYQLMIVAAVLLLVTLALGSTVERMIPETSRRIGEEKEHPEDRTDLHKLLGGLQSVFADRYLMLIALFVLMLNWINSTGEFILADFVNEYAEAQIAAGETDLTEGQIISGVMASFYMWVNFLGLSVQAFLVSRIFQVFGIGGALLIAPLVVLGGYALMMVIPIFAIVRVVKVVENGLNYSLRQTTHHALFLPVDRTATYEGKTAIDTFFWRFGDLMAAGAIFMGVKFAGLTAIQFAYVNVLFASVWLWIAWAISREHRRIMFGYHRTTIRLERLIESHETR